MGNNGYIPRKCYVSVIALSKVEGGIDPLAIIWKDGRLFKIDQIIDRSFLADMESGGRGFRYAVQILGKQRFLWQDEEGQWYVNQYPEESI